MPVYDYKCQEHGVFNDLATFDDFQKPCPCPTCGKLSPRIIRLSPDLFKLSSEERHAHQTNERAQHEPVFSTADRRENDHQHKHGCGCNKKSTGKSSLMYTANGEKMFPSARPWMISH